MTDREPIDLPRVPPRTPRPSRARQAGVAAGVLAAMAAAAVTGSVLASRDGADGDDARAQPAASPSPVASASPAAPPPAASPAPSARPPSPSPTPSPVTDAQGRVVDGTDLGLLVGVEEQDGRAVLRLDRVVFLTGEAARAAATRRGQEVEGDYFVQNDNPLVRSYPVSQDVAVTLDVPLSGKGTTGPQPTDLDGLVKALRKGRGGTSLFDLVVRGGVVVQLDHRYLP